MLVVTGHRKTAVLSLLIQGLLTISVQSSVPDGCTSRNVDYRRSLNGTSEFDWYALAPSENITWTPCFAQYKCARLLLPIDHATPNGPQIAVALQMKPATDQKNYKGTVIINPGGPGGAATTFLSERDGTISSILSQFDVLAVDPRGTGSTTPLAQCFASDAERAVWNLRDVIALNSSDGSIPYAQSREKVLGQRCIHFIGGNGREELDGTAEEWGIGRFMDSASVSTDMLRIIEKLGQDKLFYAGFSFGSVIGQYFAAMYPDKVGRLMVDGVYDAYNYRAVLWNSNLEDTDKVIASFYKFCHQAGPSGCPLYEPTAEEIQTRVAHIMRDLTPVAVPFASQGPAVITEGTIQQLILSSTYTPVELFPGLAQVLWAVETRNQTILSQFVDSSVAYKCSCQDPPAWLRQNDASPAISCSDGDPITDTPEEFASYLDALNKKSSLAAPLWSRNRLQCTEWKIRPKSRYLGPFSGNTSYPILFVSAAFDPVIPLSDARKVQGRFPGSGLLVQNSYGHTALSVPSNCTVQMVQAYFVNGTLPEDGTVCEPDVRPFGV